MANETEGTQSAQSNVISVRYGAYNMDLPLGGKTVGEIKRTLADDFNIPSDAQGKIGKMDVKDDQVVNPGDSLTFAKSMGDKGL